MSMVKNIKSVVICGIDNIMWSPKSGGRRCKGVFVCYWGYQFNEDYYDLCYPHKISIEHIRKWEGNQGMSLHKINETQRKIAREERENYKNYRKLTKY